MAVATATQPGFVVRNTFIDVCPMEEDSNSDDSSPCRSPQRRNVSAPPSPTRKRNVFGQEEAYSDQEEEEEPGAIPEYKWADGGVASAENANKQATDDKQPPWLKVPPGSPKKVPSKKPAVKKNKETSEAQAPKPPLGSLLRGNANPLLDPMYGAGYLMPGAFPPALATGGFGMVPPEQGFGLPPEHLGLGGHLGGLAQGFGFAPGFAPNGCGFPVALDGEQHMEDHAAKRAEELPEAGRRRSFGDAAERAPPVETLPPFYAGHPGMLPPFQMAHGMGTFPDSAHMTMRGGYMPSTGDAGDRRPSNFVDPATLAAVAGFDPYGRPFGAHRVEMYEQAPDVADVHGDSPAEGHGGRNQRGGRSNRGKGGGKGSLADPSVMENETGAWNAAGGDKGNQIKDETGKGDVKGAKVPLSGGGPKRTDYLKKYGGSTEEKQGATNGKQPITTMMLKNIPCRKSQEDVMAQIDGMGFTNRYDFFYLPRDVKFRANLGYAFINFRTPEDASRFEQDMNGYRFAGSGSTKACAVVPAHVQGLMNNLSAFKRTEVMRSSRKPYFQGGETPGVIVM